MNSTSHFYSVISQILLEARQKAYVSINSEMVMAYWRIGKRIVEEEQLGEKRAEYGAFLIKQLSERLSKEFGKGFSVVNIKNFRQFYLTFPDDQISYALRSQLTWTHYRCIMRVDNADARNYYITEAANQNWGTRQLERNISTLYYERLLSTRNKKQMLQDQHNVAKASPQDIIKDPYVLEFLSLSRPKEFSENQLETAIISNLQEFLLELGKGFSFVGRQYHMTHQDIGQMDMYIRMFEDLHTTEGDNSTIGIVLCAEKDQALVKYSVLDENKHIFASKYTLVLPSPEELKAELEREIHFLSSNCIH